MKKVLLALSALLLATTIFVSTVNSVKAESFEDFFSFRNFFSRVYLNLFYEKGKHSVGFDLSGSGLKNYKHVSYLVIFDSNAGKQAIKGELDIKGKNHIRVSDLYLGYCSTGGTCVDYQNVKNVSLQVTLTGNGTKILWDYIRI